MNPTPAPMEPASASHHRACTNCVRAKARCTIRKDLRETCERCHNMKKICQPSLPMRKRRTANARTSGNRVSKLEEKLDGLVELLKSDRRMPLNTLRQTPNSPPNSEQHSRESAASSPLHLAAMTEPVTQRNTVSHAWTSNAHQTSGRTPLSGSIPVTPQDPTYYPTLEEAESSLYRFRTKFVPHLPFIVISDSITAYQLRQERPILWLCIMSVASVNSTYHIALSREVRGVVANEMYLKGTRNMDLLLGVLVFATWDRRHYTPERSHLTGLVQLAIAILYDLGIDKCAPTDVGTLLMYDLKGVPKPPRSERVPTMEKRRALLACFLLSSMQVTRLTFVHWLTFRRPSCFLKKGEALRFTPYMGECLRVVETQKEFESDALLVQLVKLNLLLGRINEAPWASVMTEPDTTFNPLALFYLNSLENHLDDFKSNVPADLKTNKTLQMGICLTDLSIHEIGFSQSTNIFRPQDSHRLPCLLASLKAVTRWLETFLSIPPAEYVGFSISVYANLTRIFIHSYRLLTFENSEWDLNHVRDTLNMSECLDEAEKNFGMVRELAGIDIEGSEDVDTFTLMAHRIEAARSLLGVKITGIRSEPLSLESNAVGDLNMDLWDESWLDELMRI